MPGPPNRCDEAPVRQTPAQYTRPQFVTVMGAGGARRALTEWLLAAERARVRAIMSSSTQVEVELTLAAQPAGAVQRPHSRLAAGSLRPERPGLQVQAKLLSQVVAPGAAAAATATVTHVTIMMTVSLTS